MFSLNVFGYCELNESTTKVIFPLKLFCFQYFLVQWRFPLCLVEALDLTGILESCFAFLAPSLHFSFKKPYKVLCPPSSIFQTFAKSPFFYTLSATSFIHFTINSCEILFLWPPNLYLPLEFSLHPVSKL